MGPKNLKGQKRSAIELNSPTKEIPSSPALSICVADELSSQRSESASPQKEALEIESHVKRERLTQATQAFHPENLEGLSGPQLEEQVKNLFGHANGGSEPVGAVTSLLTIPDMNGYWPSAAACKEVADIKFLMHIIVSFVRQELSLVQLVFLCYLNHTVTVTFHQSKLKVTRMSLGVIGQVLIIDL